MKLATAIAALTLATVSAKAEDSNRTTLGILECTIEGGLGLLIGSSKAAECTFTHQDDSVEQYTGELSKLGIDIGVSGESFLKWVVFTPLGNQIGSYALAGQYIGASAGASLGIGLGANALIGGTDKKIGLQPLSIEGKTGLNLAVGLSSLTLDPVR